MKSLDGTRICGSRATVNCLFLIFHVPYIYIYINILKINIREAIKQISITLTFGQVEMSSGKSRDDGGRGDRRGRDGGRGGGGYRGRGGGGFGGGRNGDRSREDRGTYRGRGRKIYIMSRVWINLIDQPFIMFLCTQNIITKFLNMFKMMGVAEIVVQMGDVETVVVVLIEEEEETYVAEEEEAHPKHLQRIREIDLIPETAINFT